MTNAQLSFSGDAPDAERIEVHAVVGIGLRLVVSARRRRRELKHERYGLLVFLQRRLTAAVVVVALIAAARIEQRAEPVARSGTRGRDHPRAVEERVTNEELA